MGSSQLTSTPEEQALSLYLDGNAWENSNSVALPYITADCLTDQALFLALGGKSHLAPFGGAFGNPS